MTALEAAHTESAEAIRGMAGDMRSQTQTSVQMLSVLREINDRAEKRDGPILDAAARALAAQTDASARQASAVGRIWEAVGSRAGIAVLTALAVAVAQMLGLPMPRVSLDPAGPSAPHATAPDAVPVGEPAPMGE